MVSSSFGASSIGISLGWGSGLTDEVYSLISSGYFGVSSSVIFWLVSETFSCSLFKNKSSFFFISSSPTYCGKGTLISLECSSMTSSCLSTSSKRGFFWTSKVVSCLRVCSKLLLIFSSPESFLTWRFKDSVSKIYLSSPLLGEISGMLFFRSFFMFTFSIVSALSYM